MSCPNFKTMENFSLFVRDYDELDMLLIVREIEDALDDLNTSLMFHEVKLRGGHYYGIQFYVEENHNPNELDNDDCRCFFDLYRSVAIRRHKSEINKINRILGRLAQEYGFEEIYCAGVFSNGEALYYPVQNTRRARVAQVATAV